MKGEIIIYRKDVWKDLEDYDSIVALMASGIVVRGICSILKNKWTDPAVVIVDKEMRYAIPITGGHHGGNEIALKLEGLGVKAVITTAMEFEDGLSVGIGFKKDVEAKEIINAIEQALKEIGSSRDEIRVISTWKGKKESEELVKAVDHFKRPLMFLDENEINRIEVESPSKAQIIGLRGVSEACALYFSRKKELVLRKKAYGGVTVAIAR